MKKAFYTLGILALASFTFASCQKELKPENEQEGKLVTVTFVAESANTKSGVLEEGTTSVSYKWTAEDVSNMKLFTVSGNTLTQVNNPTVSKVSDTKLTITASVAANSTVRAILAKTMDENNNPIVPSIQNPGVDSFDPNADILVSEDEEVKEGMPEEGLIFKRQVTINKMTLHNLGAGEKVSSVTITSDQDLTGAGGSLTLNYTEATVPENGQFPVYFVAQPNADQNLTVTVVTDQNNYSKTLSAPVSFALGTFTKFNVGLQKAQFVKVASTDDLTSGNYLIVYEDGSVAFNGALNTLDAVSNTISVEIEDDVIAATETTDAAVFTIDISAGTIKSASGYYIGRDAASNGLNSSVSEQYENTFSFDSGNAVITGKGNTTLRYNATSGQTRFRYYGSGQKAIQLYKRVGPALPSVTWMLTSIEITTPPTKTEYTVGESFDPTGMVVTAFYEDADDDSNTRTEEIALADLTISPSGVLSTADTEITVTYNGKTATQAINVYAYNVHTVAEAIADARDLGSDETIADYYVGGIVCTTGTISSGSVTYYVSADGTSTNRFEMYKGKYINGVNFTADTNLKLGDYVVAKGTLTYYSNQSQAELASGNQVVSVFRAPVFSVPSGIYNEEQELTLTAAEGATIYYTLDGSIPTTESLTFTSAITLDEDMIVKAFAANGEFSSGVVTAEYTINANANDGSLEKPYTAEEAAALALAGNTGSYYITGVISSIQSQFSSTYGNSIFWISEDGTANTFEAYKINYFGNVNWVEGNAELAIGDEVIIYGKLTTFNTTPETESGYLVKVNGKAGLTVPTVTAAPNNGNKAITVNWGAATGSSGTITYTVTCGTQEFVATAAGSNTFTMADYGEYTVSVKATADDAWNSIATTSASLTAPGDYTVKFTASNMSKGVSGYTGTSFSITDNSFTIDLQNFNNNNRQWDFVKCGGKNGAYTGTITTQSVVTEAIKTVTLTIDAITAANITSITLYSSSDKSTWSSEGTFTKEAGNQSVTISSPEANKFYKIEAVCTKGSSNGLLTLSKVVFSTN